MQFLASNGVLIAIVANGLKRAICYPVIGLADLMEIVLVLGCSINRQSRYCNIANLLD
jgi:hypothetical protein